MIIDLGEIEVTITGIHLPIRKMPYSEQESIAKELANLLKERLGKKYELDFEFEIIQISSGCIKAKYRLKIIGGVATAIMGFVAMYGEFREGATKLWNDLENLIEFVASGRECRAYLSKNDLGIQIYGPVQEGDTLSGIASRVKESCSGYGDLSQKQIMMAVYNHNRNAFADGNLDIIYAGSVIVIPDADLIKKYKM